MPMPHGRIKRITVVPMASQCGSGDRTPSISVASRGGLHQPWLKPLDFTTCVGLP